MNIGFCPVGAAFAAANVIDFCYRQTQKHYRPGKEKKLGSTLMITILWLI